MVFELLKGAPLTKVFAKKQSAEEVTDTVNTFKCLLTISF